MQIQNFKRTCISINDYLGIGNFEYLLWFGDRLCGLVVRVLGDRSGGPALLDFLKKKTVVAPSIRKGWHSLRRQAAVARSV
jgi:hypothetical protein